jgi:16S rRNA (guanine(966)-N(2))-methyltransferase RsmD
MSLRLSGGRRLQSPPGNTARPTSSRVRLAVMNLLAPELARCAWLDLCSGSGVMACEALQRGARRVVAVEQDRRIAAVARANLDAVGQGLDQGLARAAEASPHWEVHCREVSRWLAQPGSEGFDLIYADPPYAAGLYATIAAGVAAGPWLKPGGTLVWECASSAVPPTPEGWQLRDERRYGSTSLMLLQRA